LAALLQLRWTVKHKWGAQKTLARAGRPDLVFAFHYGEQIRPRMLARVARQTGLRPEHL
jgi:hypothetical protein